MARSSSLRAVVLLVLFIILWRFGPMRVLLSPITLLRGAWGMLFTAHEVDDDSMRAAIFRITTDHKKIATLMDEFLHSPGIDPQLESQFRTFLARQRVRSFPKLETTLDWLLQLYWVILPALVFSMLCNAMARRGPGVVTSESGDETSPRGSPTHAAAPPSRSSSLRRGSGQRLALGRVSSSGGFSSGGGPSLSRPASSGGLARGLSGADIVPLPLTQQHLAAASSSGRKMF